LALPNQVLLQRWTDGQMNSEMNQQKKVLAQALVPVIEKIIDRVSGADWAVADLVSSKSEAF
jgi:hypothetical protein